MSYKAIVTSTFHGPQMTETFSGLETGENYRKLKKARHNYCLDYHRDHNTCGCGYPVAHAAWEVVGHPELVAHAEECGRDGDPYGHGYLKIYVHPANG